MSSPETRPDERLRRQYCFGDFTLDLESGFLRRGGEEVALRPKPFEVLLYLLEHHGRLVTKAALTTAVWPDTAVMDNSLSQCLVEIRRALGDDSQQLIRTVARRGYVFTAPVTTPVVEFRPQPVESAPSAPASGQRPTRKILIFILPAVAAGWIFVSLTRPDQPQHTSYTQITNFTDSAIAPALSPDGRMVAFLRSDGWFLSPDQIYVKLLPDGEPVQLTHDPRSKYGIAFSPDGSRIAYTAVTPGPLGWNTHIVSVLGGEPSLLLSNASGLTWLDKGRFLFAEMDGRGAHMGIVTAKDNRSEYRKIYFPPHERAMAHFAHASPDRKWALVVEMDPIWHPCRVVPLDGSSAGRQVGPDGRCMSAAWSPDGKWMYFGAEVDGSHHLWRQRYPRGNPEQFTFGVTQEDGVAVAPDGRSLITSVGIEQRTVWIHDVKGDRPLRSEGYLEGMHLSPRSSVRFSRDGKSVFYLLRRDSPQSTSELWRTDMESGRSEAVLREMSITEYDLSSDSQEVIFSIQPSAKAPQIWLAPLDRSSPPKLITSSGAWPVFGPDAHVLFQWSDGKTNYLVRTGKDGSGRFKVVPYPIGNIYGISPDRRWIALGLGLPDRSTGQIVAVPTVEGAARLICPGYCPVRWAPDGKFFYVGAEPSSRNGPGKTIAIPAPPGRTLPDLPEAGIRGVEDAKAFPGAVVLEGWDISPGLDPSVFAYVKTTVHRNLYRIPLK